LNLSLKWHPRKLSPEVKSKKENFAFFGFKPTERINLNASSFNFFEDTPFSKKNKIQKEFRKPVFVTECLDSWFSNIFSIPRRTISKHKLNNLLSNLNFLFFNRLNTKFDVKNFFILFGRIKREINFSRSKLFKQFFISILKILTQLLVAFNLKLVKN
jgi:hypothetical protein